MSEARNFRHSVACSSVYVCWFACLLLSVLCYIIALQSVVLLEIDDTDGEVRDRRRQEPEAQAEEARLTGDRGRRQRGKATPETTRVVDVVPL